MTPGPEEPSADAPGPVLPAFAPVHFTEDPALPADTHERRIPSATTVLLVALALAWTGFFVWTQWQAQPVDPRVLPQLVSLWAVPLLVLGIARLLLAHGAHHPERLGRSARELEEQSGQLEARLREVNRELSLAREFIGAQARDLESVGRLAVERLTGSGAQLQQLVQGNAERIEAIAGAGRAALDNMEQLRANLPVLTSATRDLGNTIGSAGRTAQDHVAELDRALGRIDATVATNVTQIAELRRSAQLTGDEFSQRADHLATIVAGRFEALRAEGDAARARIDAAEGQALAALRTRTETLGTDAERIAAALREVEAAALASWRENADRIEADVGGALVVLDNAERDAFAASRQRLLALSEDAERVDALLDERARAFADALDGRRRAAIDADDQALALFARRLHDLDAEIAARQSAQNEQGGQLAAHADEIAARLSQSENRMAAIVAQGRQARDELGGHLRDLVGALADGRERLSEADGGLRALIVSSERVRDLLDAAATRARDDLPTALSQSTERLQPLQAAIGDLRAAAIAAGERGDESSERLRAAAAHARDQFADIGERQSAASADAIAHLGHLDAIDERLRAIVEASGALTARAQADVSDMLGTLVRDLTEAGATAFDRALRNAAAQTAGRIEQAAAHAAGVGTAAASQLSQEMARVEEQTAALEARVAAAQVRAEAPLDRDFARRAALITETLNSNAIDIAAALAQDLPDTAWGAYLRGDRGVFTRRAVRLLDRGQSRDIVSLYEREPPFREHVSRYIHDFEAILRELLSARDGHVLAVTMLSSDMGKLYVALAQAIERLRQ